MDGNGMSVLQYIKCLQRFFHPISKAESKAEEKRWIGLNSSNCLQNIVVHILAKTTDKCEECYTHTIATMCGACLQRRTHSVKIGIRANDGNFLIAWRCNTCLREYLWTRTDWRKKSRTVEEERTQWHFYSLIRPINLVSFFVAQNCMRRVSVIVVDASFPNHSNASHSYGERLLREPFNEMMSWPIINTWPR